MKFPEIEIKTTCNGKEGRSFIRVQEWQNTSISFEFRENIFNAAGMIIFNAETGALNIKPASPIQCQPEEQTLIADYFKSITRLFINNFRFGWSPSTNQNSIYTIDYHREKRYLEGTEYEGRIKNMQAQIIKKVASPKKVLVAGCSDGALVENLQLAGMDAMGFDIVPDLTNMARPNMKPFLREGSVSQIPFGLEDQFDTFVAIDVLEHVPEPDIEKMVEEWLRLDIKKLVLLINLNDWFYEGHITMRPHPWWLSQWDKYFKHAQTFQKFEEFESIYSNIGTYNQQWIYCERI